MNGPLTAWGVVLLVLFGAAHYLVPSYISEAYMWVAIAVILLVLNALIGKKMKSSEGSKTTWMQLSAFGFITTLIVAFGVVPVSVSWLMSLWLLLIGAAIYSEGHANNMQMHNYWGLVLVIASLFVPGFTSWYFMAGALFLGLGGLIGGLVQPGMAQKK